MSVRANITAKSPAAPDGAYLKSVRFGQQEMLGKEIDLSQGASGELEITFRYGAAEVDGTAF